MKKSPIFIGFLQALGVFVYVAIVAAIMHGMDSVSVEVPIYFSMIAVLLLLVLSTAIVGSLIFAYPGILAIRKKIKSALWILGSSLGWLAVFLIVFFLIILV